ncbi:hypothetical protein F8M41_019618 [Gigaspora margarita]|uniref:Uncharacterized protein n=1 Tax=Gigaspora margarita TaxID=4874 RepID=A0A8H4EK99_GIGMA|nr:hypothetical protein F8M41_019618 [Gigaspora margarita]
MQPHPYQSGIVYFQYRKQDYIARECFISSQSANKNNGTWHNCFNNGQGRNNRSLRPITNTLYQNNQGQTINNQPNNSVNDNNETVLNENNKTQTYFALTADKLTGTIKTAVHKNLNA